MKTKMLLLSAVASLSYQAMGCTPASDADLIAEAHGIAYDVAPVAAPSFTSVESDPGSLRVAECTAGQWGAGHTACNNSGAGYATSCNDNGNGSITVRCSGDNTPITVSTTSASIEEDRGI